MSAHFSIVLSMLEISEFSSPFFYWTEYIVQFPESSDFLNHVHYFTHWQLLFSRLALEPSPKSSPLTYTEVGKISFSLVLCVYVCCVGCRDPHKEHCLLHVLKLNSLVYLGYLPMLTCRRTSESPLHSALTHTKGKRDIQLVTYNLRTEVP